jgi:hypothetical protein
MKAYLKTVVLGAIAAVGTITFGGAEAHATTVKATVTADNFYGILYGNKDGSQLNFVGRNETGSTGNPGQYNWSMAETWNFTQYRDKS